MAIQRNLDLDDSPKVTLLRAMEKIVREDPTVRRVLKTHSFRTWSGMPDDSKEFTIELTPAMRWTIAGGPDEFTTPDAMKTSMVIQTEILIKGNNSDDLNNFWWTIQRAFYPPDFSARQVILAKLQKAGAHSGVVLFSEAFDPDPDGVFFAAMAQIKIDVRLRLNP